MSNVTIRSFTTSTHVSVTKHVAIYHIVQILVLFRAFVSNKFSLTSCTIFKSGFVLCEFPNNHKKSTIFSSSHNLISFVHFRDRALKALNSQCMLAFGSLQKNSTNKRKKIVLLENPRVFL